MSETGAVAERWVDPENWCWRDGAVSPGPIAVFDVDGVLADAGHRQHYLEWPLRDWDSFFAECGDDGLIDEVARMLSLLDEKLQIVLLTARPMRVQSETLVWMARHGLRWDLLIMRNWGDYMAAPHFKALSVGELRAYGFDLQLAFEDDPRNVAMFENHGVPCVYIHSGYHV